MNTRRQTIWLVSMLSLMVVLSAYYLFTGDTTGQVKEMADKTQMDNKRGDATEVTQLPSVQITEVSAGEKAEAHGQHATGATQDKGTGETSGKNDPQNLSGTESTSGDTANKEPNKEPNHESNKDTTAPNGETTDKGAATGNTEQNKESGATQQDGAKSETKTDGANTGSGVKTDGAKTEDANVKDEAAKPQEKDIINQVEAEGVMKRSMIEEKQMERNQQYQAELERLMGVINNTNVNGEKLAAAYDEIHKLDEREQKITNLEAELQKDYDNAVITQENNKFKVVVQSEKLAIKQAVDIMAKLMKELEVTQDKVSVQYVSE
ncbi:SpoIIIAH-like family protein [Paenibacillus sp. 481]|uniref:SpoIIIAH-like family protein n=1 Tax=Paenibacillus sp. 481 TaxID=2835869 RepID=UPI001E31EFA1|nr:SpoIIIAH-like family protein [Paenibacillus sp. 481]UHA72875.1 SpoIIIAH-like family protein [Paenibacillus sp. 481]